MHLEVTDIDREIWQEELADFVPARLYDAHTHIYDWRADSPYVRSASPAAAWKQQWDLADWATLSAIDAALLPGRRVHRISFGTPIQDCPLDQANAFTAREVAQDDQSAALMLVRPQLAPDEMDRQYRTGGFRGVKPYRLHSVTGDVVECRITDYLPQRQIEVVDSHGGMVMLHLSKRRAIADEQNLADLEDLTQQYPRVQWVLAHCARSYFERPLLKAGPRLKQIPNLWYEISSVCDSDAMEALLELAGSQRVMYGTDDLPVGVTRGKYITFAQAWCELNAGNHSLNLSHCRPEMTFVRYEGLRALRSACRRRGLTAGEVENIFYNNARRLIETCGPALPTETAQ